jgi:hypothetical protein
LFLNRLPPELMLSPLNPVFPDISKAFTKADLERLRDFLEKLILDNEVEETILLVARIEKRSEMLSCFREAPKDRLKPGTITKRYPLCPGLRARHCSTTLGTIWVLGISALVLLPN